MVQVGRGSGDKLQVAFDAMLGVREAIADRSVSTLRGIRDAFQTVTGLYDYADFLGAGFYRTRQTISTTDFPSLLKNSMTKRLIQDYAEIGMGGLERLISETDVDNFKTQDRVRLGYYSDLPSVSENAAYLEFTKPTDETINYSVSKFGGFQDITWETIVNDDLGKVASFPTRVARAARRTLKQAITNFFVNNPNYDPDTTAIFHASHNNLGSVALGSTELDAREVGLLTQTEKDSNKRLGLPLDWIMVPPQLKSSANQVNNNDSGTNNWFHRFGNSGENIIVNELLSDANDWYGGSFPATAPFLEIGYLRGFRTPRIFTVPVDERRAVTAIDKIQLYGLQVFGGDFVDFRPVFKNVV